MHYLVTITAWTLPCLASAAVAAEADQANVTQIIVDATLYHKHQVCLADVRDTAGTITAVSLTPAVSRQNALDELMVRLYWDELQTPFVTCSVRQFLELFGLPFESRREAQVIQHLRPQLADDPFDRADARPHEPCHCLDALPNADRLLAKLVTQQRQVEFERAQRLPEIVVNVTGDPLAFPFACRFEIGGHAPELFACITKFKF